MQTLQYDVNITVPDGWEPEDITGLLRAHMDIMPLFKAEVEGPWTEASEEDADQAMAALRNKLNGDENGG